MVFLLILGHFWCSVVISIPFGINLSNFERNSIKNLNILKKYTNKSITAQKNERNHKTHKYQNVWNISTTTEIKRMQKPEEEKNIPENFIIYFCPPKKFAFSYFCHLGRLVFNQSAPVHTVSESSAGWCERDGGGTDGGGGGRKSLCLILDATLRAK